MRRPQRTALGILAATGVALGLASAPSSAGVPQEVSARAAVASSSKPLVYIFVLDGLDGDQYDKGRLPFVESIVNKRGTYYQESRSIMVAETNPNHTAMITGAYGDTSGIPANGFALYGNGASSVDGCPLTTRGDGPTKAGLAPGCVQAQTFFQSTATKSVRNRITSAAIMGKPKLATLYSAKRSKKKYAADYLWTPCTTSSKPDYCGKAPTNSSGYADDKHTMDTVLKTVRNGVKAEGGKRKKPNLTFVNMPSLDSTGHAYGVGKKYRKAAKAADKQIQRFVKQQKKLGLWSRTVMFVLSDHSMATTGRKTSLTEQFIAAGIPKESFVVVPNGGTDLVYLTDRTSPERFDLLRRMRAAALADTATTGIDEALYREANPLDADDTYTLDGVHPDWHLAGPRTGDLVVTQWPGGAFTDPVNPTAGGHGAPDTTDNFFAITGGWKGLVKNGAIAGQAGPRFDDTALNPGQAENVDVAPTAMRLLGLEPPRDNRGRDLAEAFKGW